jgi:hypothetical protein
LSSPANKGSLPPAPLPSRAVYTVRELADASSLSRRRTLRLLRNLGIQLIRSGPIWLVPLEELEQKGKRYWASVRAAELRRLLTE